MLADFFTKPLQGAFFTRLSYVILGHKHINSLDVGPTPEPEERDGREQAIGCGTDKPDDDRFILVRGRIKYNATKGYVAVAPVEVDMSGNEWTGKRHLLMKYSNDISRAHSLKTILLIDQSLLYLTLLSIV